jgi:hypothetical protein
MACLHHEVFIIYQQVLRHENKMLEAGVTFSLFNFLGMNEVERCDF